MYYDVVIRGATHRVFVEEYTADVVITASAAAGAGGREKGGWQTSTSRRINSPGPSPLGSSRGMGRRMP